MEYEKGIKYHDGDLVYDGEYINGKRKLEISNSEKEIEFENVKSTLEEKNKN